MTWLTLPGGAIIDAEEYPTLAFSHSLDDEGKSINQRVVLTSKEGKQLIFEGDRADRVMELMKAHYKRSVDEANGDLLLTNDE